MSGSTILRVNKTDNLLNEQRLISMSFSISKMCIKVKYKRFPLLGRIAENGHLPNSILLACIIISNLKSRLQRNVLATVGRFQPYNERTETERLFTQCTQLKKLKLTLLLHNR